jgi:HK97 gp10 family phage protein
MGFFLETKTLGIPEVSALIREIDHDLKHDMRSRLKQGASLVADEAKERTTSRRVRSAISFQVQVNSLIDYRAVVGPERRKAFFAHFLEFGTSHSRAFPFLLPAAATTEEQVVSLVGVPFVLREGRA